MMAKDEKMRSSVRGEKVAMVHIITKLELGGAQQTTLYTLTHADRDRYCPVLICGSGGILLPEAQAIPGLAIHICPYLVREIAPLRDCAAFITIWWLLRRIKRDHRGAVLVHTHSSKAGILGRWAAFLAGIPVRIHTVHGFGFHPYQPFWVQLVYILAEQITGLVTTRMVYVSHHNLRTGIRLGISKKGNSFVVRSGIDWEQFSQARGDGVQVREEFGVPKGDKMVGMVACFKPQKAPLDFVRMAHLVRQALPGTHFLLIGDGELRGDVERLIHRLGLQGFLHMTGWRRDIPSLMNACDIMALTSLWEGLPKVVIEAQLMGIPVVATDTSGVEEVVRDGVSGFIVPPGRPDIMAGRIIELLENPRLLARMRREARSVPREFDCGEGIGVQDALYRSLIKR